MEIVSIQKFVHRTPRKLRLVVDMVRKMHPNQAMQILQFTPKMGAKDISKAVSSALANAKQQGLNIDQIIFEKIEINEGPRMRRFRAGSKGRALPYKRRMSHIKIVLSDEVTSNKELSRKSLESSKKESLEISESLEKETKNVKKVEKTTKVKKGDV